MPDQSSQRAGYECSGPPGAFAIILIHGAAWTRAEWLPLLPALSDEFRVLALDLPGHGVFADQPFRLASAVHTVYDALEDLGAASSALVVGHSLGGYVAIASAFAHPQRVAGLLLSGCCVDYRLLGHLSALDASLSLKLYGERRILAMQEKTVRELAPDDAEALIAAGFTFGVMPAVYRELAGQDFRTLLRKYPGPTLILNGEHDRPNRWGERKMLAACQQGQLATIADAGHACTLEQPAAFAGHVRAMARSLMPR